MMEYQMGYQMEALHCGASIYMLKNQKIVGFCVVGMNVLMKDDIYLQRQ